MICERGRAQRFVRFFLNSLWPNGMFIQLVFIELRSGVHRFATRYALHFNRRHKKRGYVFQGRFRSILVEGECFMRGLYSLHSFNPLEAGLTVKPEDYRWSSHNAYF